jgi:hypothetical protein
VFGKGIGHGNKGGQGYQGPQDGPLDGNPERIKKHKILHDFLIRNKGKTDGVEGNQPRVGGGLVGDRKAEGIPEGVKTGKTKKAHDNDINDIKYPFAKISGLYHDSPLKNPVIGKFIGHDPGTDNKNKTNHRF